MGTPKRFQTKKQRRKAERKRKEKKQKFLPGVLAPVATVQFYGEPGHISLAMVTIHRGKEILASKPFFDFEFEDGDQMAKRLGE